MSFQYDRINLTILDDLKKICEKSSHDWTEEEYRQVIMTIEAIKIAMNQRGKCDARARF